MQIIQLLMGLLQEHLVDQVVDVENIIMAVKLQTLETQVVLVHLKEIKVEILTDLDCLHQELKALLLEVVELVQLVQALLGTPLLRKQETVGLVQLIQFQALL